MSRALAFAAGLGRGYIDEDRYQDRQALLDREMALRESEYQTRKSIADEQLKRIQDEGKLKTALADAAKQAEVKQSTTLDTGDGAKVYDMPAGVNSQDVASSDARQFQRNAEATGAEVPAPKIDSTTTVNGKAYDDPAAGLAAAKAYNDPIARSDRIAGVYEKFGRPDAAMAWREKAEARNQAILAAAGNALANSVLSQPSLEAGFKHAQSAINPILERQKLRLVGGTPVSDGSISFTLERQADDGSWEFAGQNFSAKSLDDLAEMVRRQTVPGYALSKSDAAANAKSKIAMAAAEEEAKQGAKPIELDPQKALYKRGADGKYHQVAVNTAEPASVLAEREKQRVEAPKIISDTLKDAPQFIGAAADFSAKLRASNPGMLPDTAHAIGIRLAQNGGQGIITTLNPATGRFERHFSDAGEKDKSGKVISPGSGNTYKLDEQDFAPGGPISESQAKESVSAMAASLPPEVLKTYVDAKTTEGLKRYNEAMLAKGNAVLSGAEAEVKKARDAGDKGREAAIKRRMDDDLSRLAADQRRMMLVSRFYTPTADRAAAGQPQQQRAAQQPATQQPSDPGPKPSPQSGEPMQAYRDRLIAWDRQRMSYLNAQDAARRAASNAASEQERLRLLQGRPDLQRMRGMR